MQHETENVINSYIDSLFTSDVKRKIKNGEFDKFFFKEEIMRKITGGVFGISPIGIWETYKLNETHLKRMVSDNIFSFDVFSTLDKENGYFKYILCPKIMNYTDYIIDGKRGLFNGYLAQYTTLRLYELFKHKNLAKKINKFIKRYCEMGSKLLMDGE